VGFGEKADHSAQRFLIRLDGRKVGALCAEVPNHRDIPGGYPEAIQSFITLCTERASSLRRVSLSSVTPLGPRGPLCASSLILISRLSPGLRHSCSVRTLTSVLQTGTGMVYTQGCTGCIYPGWHTSLYTRVYYTHHASLVPGVLYPPCLPGTGCILGTSHVPGCILGTSHVPGWYTSPCCIRVVYLSLLYPGGGYVHLSCTRGVCTPLMYPGGIYLSLLGSPGGIYPSLLCSPGGYLSPFYALGWVFITVLCSRVGLYPGYSLFPRGLYPGYSLFPRGLSPVSARVWEVLVLFLLGFGRFKPVLEPLSKARYSLGCLTFNNVQ